MSKKDIEKLISDLKVEKGYDTYFRTEQVTERVCRIVSLIEEIEMMYLINGFEKSVLIDTGNGIRRLKPFIEQLTNNPVVVLLSHGHDDHIMSSGEFDGVYLNKLDWELFYKYSHPDHCMETIKYFRPLEFESVTCEDLCNCTNTRLKPLENEMVFDLGGITVRALDAFGHTPGSMAFLIEEDRLLFLGDACNNMTCIFHEESLDIKTFQTAIKTLRKRTDGLYDKVLFSHCLGEGPVTTMDDVIEVCDDILNGEADEIEFPFIGYITYWAKEVIDKGPEMDQPRGDITRVDGKYGNVLYTMDKII